MARQGRARQGRGEERPWECGAAGPGSARRPSSSFSRQSGAGARSHIPVPWASEEKREQAECGRRGRSLRVSAQLVSVSLLQAGTGDRPP